MLIEAQGGEDKAKYGNALIKEYSEKLTNEIGRGYTILFVVRKNCDTVATIDMEPLLRTFGF